MQSARPANFPFARFSMHYDHHLHDHYHRWNGDYRSGRPDDNHHRSDNDDLRARPYHDDDAPPQCRSGHGPHRQR
jgi:hypothetical protein